MNRSINIAHSKLKSPAILFESLARTITADCLEGRTDSPALNILKKYFNPNRELGKEFSLYQACVNADSLNESRALQFLKMVVDQRRKLNEIELTKEKYELIKEIKKNYDLKEFMSCKIPNYKIYVSIYKTFLAETKHVNDSILNIQDVASARFTLLEHLLGNRKKPSASETALLKEFKNQTEDLRLLTYKILIDKFNEKYSILNDRQKILLREYVNNISGQNTFGDYIRSEIPKLQSELGKSISTVTDAATRIKLNEVVSQLSNFGKKKNIGDNELTAILLAMEISKEVHK